MTLDNILVYLSLRDDLGSIELFGDGSGSIMCVGEREQGFDNLDDLKRIINRGRYND